MSAQKIVAKQTTTVPSDKDAKLSDCIDKYNELAKAYKELEERYGNLVALSQDLPLSPC